MKAFVLAAGLGLRLRPLTDNLPKPLLPVGGKLLIAHTFELLSRLGVRDVMINIHYLPEKMLAGLGDGSQFGVRICYSYEPILLGTGGGLEKVRGFFQNETCLVLNGDTFVTCDLDAMVSAHRASGALATMLVRSPESSNNDGRIETDASMRVCSILGQPSPERNSAACDRRTWMFAGVHVLEPRFFSYLRSTPSCIIRTAYLEALQAGELIGGFEQQGPWADVGTPELYAEAERMIRTVMK